MDDFFGQIKIVGTPRAPAKCAVELLTVTNTSKFFKILIRLSKSLNKSTLSKLYIVFPLFLKLLISQISGALAVNILGNSGYPKINEILKTVKYYKDSLRNN